MKSLKYKKITPATLSTWIIFKSRAPASWRLRVLGTYRRRAQAVGSVSNDTYLPFRRRKAIGIGSLEKFSSWSAPSNFTRIIVGLKTWMSCQHTGSGFTGLRANERYGEGKKKEKVRAANDPSSQGDLSEGSRKLLFSPLGIGQK